jgi:Glycosyltransferase sugar-binding region containing DXD motif
MTDKLVSSAIDGIDSLYKGPIIDEVTNVVTGKIYDSTKYYIRILLITCVILFLLSVAFSCTTFWANYVVVTNRRTVQDILNKIEEAERVDRPIYDYTYRSIYNYDSLGEIEKLLHSQYSEALDSGVKSVALEDLRIENSNGEFNRYLYEDPNSPSPLMVSLVRDSWLSASNAPYILDKSNTNRIVAEFFVDSKDIDTLSAFLESKSSSNTYELTVPESDIILIMRFNMYDRDNRNRVFYRTLTQNSDGLANPSSIHIDQVLPHHVVKIRGRGDIRVFKQYEPLTDTDRPSLFYYWQNEKGKKTPAHITLAHKTIEKHCSKSFRLKKLDEKNIFEYLPELKPYRKRIESFKICHRVDIYRIYLLYKYGGLYVDSDTVVLKDLLNLIKPLDTIADNNLRIEYIGFGCTGKTCEDNGYMRPSNGLMGARRGAFLMHDIRQNINNLVLEGDKIKGTELDKENKTYFMIGKRLIWFALDRMTDAHRYRYMQVDPNLIGIRDKDGKWVTNNRLFKTKNIEYKDEKSMYLLTFYNSDFNDPELMQEAKESDIIDSKMQIARFFKRALK